MIKLENIWSLITSYQLGIFNKHWRRDVWYNYISCHLWPRQKWLTSKIPKTWVDKDHLMEICILESIKHYVEGEGVLDYFDETQKDPTYPEHQREFERQVKEMYQLITITLPTLEEALVRAWKTVPDFFGPKDPRSFEEIYGEVNRLDKEIADLKTKVMVWAVRNREFIWT